MSEAVTIAIIMGGSSVAASSLSAYLSHKAHKAVNSRWDEFVTMAKTSYRAEGVEQERSEERLRKDIDKSAQKQNS